MAARRSRKRSSAATKGGGLFAFRWTRRTIGIALFLAAFLASQIAVTVVPYQSVPDGLKPVWMQVLAFRNKGLSRSGLPVDWYSTSSAVESGDAHIQVYFAPSTSIDDHLVDFIASAKKSVDMCIYDLDLDNVVAALVACHQRGVRVRVVTDTDNARNPALSPLNTAGVPIVEDRRPAIMHDKFVVVDGERLWTGSYNFTVNGTTKNDNNALTIDSTALATNYSTEFAEMWAGQFGPTSPAATPYRRVNLADGIVVDTYFAPEDGVMDRVLQEVGQAKSSVQVMAFSFTSDALARALRNRIADGVTVRCLFDTSQAGSQYSEDEHLKDYGATVRLSANHRGVMHHKVIIIDDTTVITGSFNFSANADTANDENLLIIRSPALAALYHEEFDRCWSGVKGY